MVRGYHELKIYDVSLSSVSRRIQTYIQLYSFHETLLFEGRHLVILLMMLGLVGQTINIVGGGTFDDAFSPLQDLLALFKQRFHLLEKLALITIFLC